MLHVEGRGAFGHHEHYVTSIFVSGIDWHQLENVQSKASAHGFSFSIRPSKKMGSK